MTAPIELDDAALRAWPLPRPSPDDDKEARGRVLVVAGSAEMPGAAVLAGEAALRAGAGKLVVGTSATVAAVVAQQLPEARVVALPEDDDGGLLTEGVERLDKILAQTRSVLVGPGMAAGASTVRLVEALLGRLNGQPVLLDAAAMDVVRQPSQAGLSFSCDVGMTPHAGEMAQLRGEEKESIESDPGERARIAAKAWGAVVALKGACTWLAAPDGRLWRHARGNPGLATSGSGDVLAGLVAGLMARGAPVEQALAWGVALHARAADRLAARMGPLGFLARELSAEVPSLMATLA
jgi:ADP-dependent NAD(P)H-hydrate dehydratase